MRTTAVLCLAAALLSGCATTRIGDPRAQQLLSFAGPKHYGERQVARELADRCRAFEYDADLALDMNAARTDSADALTVLRGAIGVEADIKRRSLAARYGDGQSYAAIDPCTVLRGELSAGTPLSVMVVNA